MKITSLIASRPVLIFIFLAFVVMLLPSIAIPCWYKTTKRIERNVGLINQNLRLGLISEMESTEKFFRPINSSAINLARVLASSLSKNHQLSFAEIKNKAAPILFQAYSVIPHVSQISYIGSNGLFFSFFMDKNQTLALFSNSTFPSDSTTACNDYTWYLQHIDQETGDFYGDAVKYKPWDLTNAIWFQRALDNKVGYAFLGTGWGPRTRDSLIINAVSVHGKKGVVSLGFPVKALTDIFEGLKLFNGELYLSTIDGSMLLRGPSNASFIFSNNSICFYSMKHSGDQHLEIVPCVPVNDKSGTKISEIQNSENWVYFSILEIAGVPLVYALMFPNKGLATIVSRNSMLLLILLSLLAVSVIVSIFSFVLLMVRATMREIHLCATLISQMETTQQAERKSMNKSLAFATASHDIRASLAGITGLIELCYQEVDHGSELETNLKQMQGCAKDLVGLLNSILDMSKIEAGKMQLEEEEFNLAELLEDVVDSFHPVAMKKGVDVVLDTHESTILRFSHVRGDRGKLKQILNNLMSNAVKFTTEGHVLLRGWAQKPIPKSSVVLAPNQNGILIKCLRFFNRKREDTRMDAEAVNLVRRNSNEMEFVFQVDDTGKGIPKENWQSVFENYVQVIETAHGQQGTGLGLGIVQSLVRLMGGEIRIINKEIGQKGTCFQFNVFLKTSKTSSSEMIAKPDIEAKGSSGTIRSLSPRLNNLLSPSPKPEGSQVVLLIKDEGRQRIVQKYMENLGINVMTLDKWKHLGYVLKRIQSRTTGFVLLVIDASVGPFPELNDAVKQFRGALNVGICCKVVWLNKPSQHGTTRHEDDISLLKPLHGSRLVQVVKWLPEFGGALPMEVMSSGRARLEVLNYNELREMQEENLSNDKKLKKKISSSPSASETQLGESSRNSSFPCEQTEIQGEEISKAGEVKGLRGKRVLVAEDNLLHAKIARTMLKNLGASIVDECLNGAEAVRLVCDRLREQQNHRGSYYNLPYDYIFMDSEMPNTDGHEATRSIRKMERCYGIHIPIIGVTAHECGSVEANRLIAAGMDVLLNKPMSKAHVMEAIKCIHTK